MEEEHPSGCPLLGRPSHPDLVRTLIGMWDAPMIDLFTTRLNKWLPLYYIPPYQTTKPVCLLGGPQRLCVSLHLLSHPICLEQDSQLLRQVVPDCAMLAQPGQVSSPVGALDGSPTQAPRMGSPAVAPNGEGLSRDHLFLQRRLSGISSEREAFQKTLSRKCLGLKHSRFLLPTTASGPSSQAGVEFSPLSPTLPQVLDFLNFIFSEKKFLVQAMKGYRSPISSTLHLLAGSWGFEWDAAISSLTIGTWVWSILRRSIPPPSGISRWCSGPLWGSPMSPWISEPQVPRL
jgi:hypothetical protein